MRKHLTTIRSAATVAMCVLLLAACASGAAAPAGRTGVSPVAATAVPTPTLALPSPTAGQLEASLDRGLLLVDQLTVARSEAPRRAAALDALHGWLDEERDTAVPTGDRCRTAVADRDEALDTLEHALGLFHHIGLERSYEVLDMARSEMESAAGTATACSAAR
jgi:hypothetical protein